MPFGEVMYRCNAHYCFSSVFRNRVAGLVVTLALMQLFLFSFYLNGLHSQAVNVETVNGFAASSSASSELPAVIPAPLRPIEKQQQHNVLAVADETARGGGNRIADGQSPDPDLHSPPLGAGGQEKDWGHISSKTRLAAKKALDHLMTNNKPAMDIVASAAKKLTAAAIAGDPSAVAADPMAKMGLNFLASALLNNNQQLSDKSAGSKSQYSNLAQMGLQLLTKNYNGSGGSSASNSGSNKGDAAGMLNMATQFMMKNSKVDPQMAKSALGFLMNTMGNQKLDPKLMVPMLGMAAKMMQQQPSTGTNGQRGSADIGLNLLSQVLSNSQLRSALLSSGASMMQPSTAGDQSASIYRNYLKLTSKKLPAVKSKMKLPEPSVSKAKVVVDLDFKYPIQEMDSCAKPNTTFLVAVISHAAHAEDRQAARLAWIRDFQHLSGGRVNVLFFIGQTSNITLQRLVQEESNTYHDMIQTNVQEPAEHVVYKTLASLVWVNQFCSTVKQILRIDDNVYISADKMLKLMEKNKMGASISGNVVSRIDPHDENEGN